MLSARALNASVRSVIHINKSAPIRSLMAAADKIEQPTFKTLKLERPAEFVVNVQLNRPKQRNALTTELWSELRTAFEYLDTDQDCRVVLLTGNGKSFCAGLDFGAMGAMGATVMDESLDVSRKAFAIRRMVAKCQDDFTALEKCAKPVLCAIHDACIGGALSLVTAADVRYATKCAYFSLKEVDIGIAADVGALQRMPKIMGNEGLVRELAYTARQFDAKQALEYGLLSELFDSQEQMMSSVLATAVLIASKSPVAVQGSKLALNYSRDHSVQEGLDFQRTWNSCHLQSEDLLKSAMAAMQKEPTPPYAKL